VSESNMSALHNNWKRCNWWFQDKCNAYEYCEFCDHWGDSVQKVQDSSERISITIRKEMKEKGLI
jgi:hypothetical protein